MSQTKFWKALRLTADDAAELRQRLAEPPSLPAEGADAWTCAVTAKCTMALGWLSQETRSRFGHAGAAGLGRLMQTLFFAATVRRVLQS